MAHLGRASSRAERRILVVDDQASTRASIVDILSAGYNAEGVANAGSALTLLATPRTHFDLVIVSHVVSDRPHHVACVELVRAIFTRWPWVPVIVINGKQPSERLLADVLLTGARDFLGRPFGGAELTELVERVLRRVATRTPAAPKAIATMKRVLHTLAENAGEIPALAHLARRRP